MDTEEPCSPAVRRRVLVSQNTTEGAGVEDMEAITRSWSSEEHIPTEQEVGQILCCTALYCTVLYCTVQVRQMHGLVTTRQLPRDLVHQKATTITALLKTWCSWS